MGRLHRGLAFNLSLSVLTVSAVMGPAADAAPCATLRHGSAIIRASIHQINSMPGRFDKGVYDRADRAIHRIEWRITTSGSDGDWTYRFQPADFDGDGRIDTMRSECGSGETQMCFLTFDRGDGKVHQLQKGFMYLTRIQHRFYVVWDYTATPIRISNGGPRTNFSQYFAATTRGFSEVCKGTRG